MSFMAKLKYKTPFEKKSALRRLFDKLRDKNWECRFAAISEEVRHGVNTRHLHILVEYDSSKVIFRCFTWSQDNNLTPTIEEIAVTNNEVSESQSPRFAVSRQQCHAAIMLDEKVSLVTAGENHYFCEPRGGPRQHLLCASPTMLHLQITPSDTPFPKLNDYVTTQNCEDSVAQEQKARLVKGLQQMAISSDRGYAVCAAANTEVNVFRARASDKDRDLGELLWRDHHQETSPATAVEVAEDVAVVVYQQSGRFYVYRIGEKSTKLLCCTDVGGNASVAAISSNTHYIAVACTTRGKQSEITLWELVTGLVNVSLKELGRFWRPKVRAMRFLAENELVVVAKCSCYYYMLG
ncbi:hypothetical protein BU17DRAFT_68038 [Hysterangium stoloniferum]|nr:hypothetical protein BU17DRAFT_68038 [Hysterangium stoloniferum]